jgi:hypothetical protein
MTVNHGKNEYARDGKWHVNTAECYFTLCKRAGFGAHHSVSEAHLHRYIAEWDFTFYTRKITDGERAALARKGAEGRRLPYSLTKPRTRKQQARRLLRLRKSKNPTCWHVSD